MNRLQLLITRSTNSRAYHTRTALALAAVATLSCAGKGNTGEKAPDPFLVQAVPWLNGVYPAYDAGSPIIPPEPVYPPIASGLPDPGSRPANCNSLVGIVTSPDFLSTFEPDVPPVPNAVGVATAWAGFDDLTRYSFHAPGDVTWYPGLNGMLPGEARPRFNAAISPWGLAAAQMGGPSCDGKPNNWSLHLKGGSFRKWGAGVSHVFTDPAGICLGSDICPPPPVPGAAVDSAGIPVNVAYLQSHAFVDASNYEGVAFWARRGPEGQERMIVTITDNFTSDRLARENQKYCRRLRACYTHCLNQAPCTPAVDSTTSPPTTVYRCWDPQAGPLPGTVASASGAPIPALLDLLFPRCGPSACTSPVTYLDNDFDGKECRPYTFPAADVSGEYCYNPGDPPPPDRDEQCLDGWARTVGLTTDWQYYTVPFSELRQGGFGKVAPYFNIKAIDTIAFGFIVGWADAYVDNVTFYRRTN